MAQEIEWTQQALADYYTIILYLEKYWNTSIADDFMRLTERRLQTLAEQPLLGLASERQPHIRSVLLTKHNRLYFQNKGTRLIVLNIFDTRQDPATQQF